MKRSEFFLLQSFIHYVDNTTADINDKLYKVRNLFNMLTIRFQRHYVLNREITIDERMIKYTDRANFLQFIRNKPTQWGFKVFVLADAHNGYVYNWKVFTGAEPGNRRNATQNILKELISGLHLRNHILFFDSYFAYVPCIVDFSTKGIGCVGTLQKSRRFLPNEIKNPGTMQRGDSQFRKSGNLIVLAYKDKKVVRMITNMHGAVLDNGRRPVALSDYNKWARGVDISNQLVSSYHNNHKTMKWYKALALSFLKTSIANAYQLFKVRNPFQVMSHLQFRENLVVELLQEYLNQLNEQINVRPREERRLIVGMHHLQTRKQGRCLICSTEDSKKITFFIAWSVM